MSSRPPPVRVLVVDDDPVLRRLLSRVVEGIEGAAVVGTAANLSVARARIQTGNVDVVTIDAVMRDESGLDLLAWVRREHPRILAVLLTAGTSQESRAGVDGLLLGAAAVIVKPADLDATEALSDALATVLRDVPRREPSPGPSPAIEGAIVELIAIGASTGGPPVVVDLLRSLPTDFQVPIVLVQHMPALHVPYFVELLARSSGRDVRMARHGEPILPGVTYVAGDGLHLLVERKGGALVLAQDDGPPEHHCKPAVDPLFRSVASACGPHAVGVVLTGMGQDGAPGALALRARGAPVIVQDRETSVVWGMPGAVVAVQAASVIVPAQEIAPSIVRQTAGWKSSTEKSHGPKA